jgi:type IV pilus assembly protein PilM
MFSLDLKGSQGTQMIGVDIGLSSIKIVQLHGEHGTPTLDTYGELQLGPYANADIGKTTDLEQKRLTEALVDIIRESAANANTAALAISYGSSFATRMTVNAVEEADIATRVPVEARKYIPIALSEVTLDWFPLAARASPPQTDLFLVAIHNETLERLRGTLTGSGLGLSYSELEPFSAARAVLTREQQTAAIVDFGASGTRIYITKGGIIQETHILAGGGAAMTEEFAAAAHVSFAEAEERTRADGLAAAEKFAPAARAMRTLAERTLHEVGRIIAAYERADAPLPSTCFVGGASALPGLAPLAEDILQRKLMQTDPFAKVAYPAFLSDTLLRIGPSFAVALGAALRHFEQH